MRERAIRLATYIIFSRRERDASDDGIDPSSPFDERSLFDTPTASSHSINECEREPIGNRRRRRREAHDTHRLTRLESAPPSAEEIDPRKPRFPDSCLCTQVQVRRRPQPRESREFSSQHRTSLVDRMVLDAQSVEIGKHQILPVREISAQVIAFQVAAHRSVERERERERARERERDRESER